MAVNRMTNREVRGMIRQPRILQKYYIYDPNVGDELGGLRVMQDKDPRGDIKEDTKHVLAVQQQVQFFIDQGLLGDKPVGEITGKSKAILAQVTRGRSEDNDKAPTRVPRYDRRTMSGAPSFAGMPIPVRSKKKQTKDKKSAKKPSNTPLPGSTNELPGSTTSTTGKPTTRA